MIPINFSGIDQTVDEIFFNRISIIEEELFGDTYFIKFNSSNGVSYLSVHKNFYEPIKRNLKIDNLLT